MTMYLLQDEAESQSSSLLSVLPIIQEPPTPTANTYLHIQTEGLDIRMPPPENATVKFAITTLTRYQHKTAPNAFKDE